MLILAVHIGWKEVNVLFNDALNTFGIGHMVQDHSDSEKEETRCCHYMGYFFSFAARDLFYAQSHRQDSTYPGLSYTSCRAVVGTLNSSLAKPDVAHWLEH